MKKLNKILAVGLSLAMCAGMVTPALAASYCINDGSVTISSRDDSVWVKHGNNDEVEDKGKITVTGTGDVTNNTITVGENVQGANITLDGVNIDSSSTGKAAIGIGAGSNVTIELDGNNEVKSGSNKAGVSVGGGASLAINDANGTEGSLTATGNSGGAGIGGDNMKAAGDITINGGTIIANGGGEQGSTIRGGAGIGSGAGGSANSVTINDGTVTANGGNGGAGIGAGHTGTFGDITVENGTVTANGGQSAAGIGTGRYDINKINDANSINIKGGVVTATGGTGGSNPSVSGGAGIGTGTTMYQQKVGQINITGGTVNATGGSLAAGIGSARGSWSGIFQRVDEINISGASTNVTAIGGLKDNGDLSASGIGAGDYSKIGKIEIGGGTVKATGTTGIGTSNSASEVDAVNITGGTVSATGKGGAGIGSASGSNTKVETISISGGTVTATGYNFAAGIGGGSFGSFGAINITGGDIIAKSGINASGIGNGNSGTGGTIAIKGADSLVALGDTYFAIDTRANVEGVAQSILNGKFLEKINNKTSNGLNKSVPTTFVVVDANGKERATFTLDTTTTKGMYESFAVNLPEGEYYVFESSDVYKNSIASYEKADGKQIAYVISANDMLNADLMQFPSYNVGYKFESATEGKELPEEITNMELGGSTGNELTYANFLEMVKRGDSFEKVHTEDGGTWTFNTWTKMRPVTTDGQKITDVELVGTWSFCGHEHKTTTNTKEPTCTEPGESQTVCDDCHEVLSTGDVVSALDHDYGEWQEVTAATCTEDGLERQVCSRDESHVVERVIPAIDHDWDDGVITRQPTETEEGEITYTCQHDSSHTYTESIPRLFPDPDTEIEDPDVPLGEEPDDIEIEDPEVPLAGIFTRADAIGYLWEQTGSPDAELSDFPDVPEDHYWAVAIGWAQDMGIALPDEDGNFRPDDLVLRSSSEPEGELQQFLNRYAVFAGAAEQGETFIQLTGASDDIIMGEEAQVIFDEFFAKLEAALTRKAA